MWATRASPPPSRASRASGASTPTRSVSPFEGRTALLSPFDRLIHDRDRALELFDFEYVLEMYKPEAQRRWGYFALPVLHHDRLVGKVDATADRKSSTLRVHAIHQDVPFTRAIDRAVADELDSWRPGCSWMRSSTAAGAESAAVVPLRAVRCRVDDRPRRCPGS